MILLFSFQKYYFLFYNSYIIYKNGMCSSTVGIPTATGNVSMWKGDMVTDTDTVCY